jgi:hypothetical protein
VDAIAVKGGIRAGVASGSVTLFACVAVIATTPDDAYWIGDCGAKALLARHLVSTGFGSLVFDYPASALDPSGAAFPIVPPFAVRHGNDFVSQYPPAYPAVAAPFLAWLGPAGLRVPAALGAAACAFLFAVWTAPVFGVRWASAGGIVLTVATPLFFYGVTVWEHSITVALVLGAVVALARRDPGRFVLGGSLVAAAGWFREETLLALPALALASYVRDRNWRDLAWIAAGAAPVVASLAAFNFAAFGNPLGVHVTANLHTRPPLIESIRHAGTLLGGLGTAPQENTALALAALTAIALGATALRGEGSRTIGLVGAALIGASIWSRGTTSIFRADVPFIELARYNGLAVQLPFVCLAGFGAARIARDSACAPLRLGILTGLGFLAFFLPFRVTVSEFAIGGHWGPRMLLPAAPALVALALAAVQRPAGVPNRVGRAIWALGIGAGLLSSALAMTLLVAQKREASALQQRISAAPQEVLVTTHPALGQHLAEIWGDRPMLLARNPAGLAGLTVNLRDRGFDEFLLIWKPTPQALPARVGNARCTPAGRHTGIHVRRIFDVDLLVCTLPGAASSR